MFNNVGILAQITFFHCIIFSSLINELFKTSEFAFLFCFFFTDSICSDTLRARCCILHLETCSTWSFKTHKKTGADFNLITRFCDTLISVFKYWIWSKHCINSTSSTSVYLLVLFKTTDTSNSYIFQSTLCGRYHLNHLNTSSDPVHPQTCRGLTAQHSSVSLCVCVCVCVCVPSAWSAPLQSGTVISALTERPLSLPADVEQPKH